VALSPQLRGQIPQILQIVNAASAAPQLAGGSVATLYGSNLAGATATAGQTPLPVSLAGTSLTVNGQPAPLLYVSPGQINFQMPWEVMGNERVTIAVQSSGLSSNGTSLDLTPFAPGAFTVNGGGAGQAAVLIAGPNSPVAAPAESFPGSRPALPGEFLEIFCTGLGPIRGEGPATGEAAPVGVNARTAAQPHVMIGGVPAILNFSGLAPGLVGIYQLNVQVPANTPIGDAVELSIDVGGASSNKVTVAIGAPAEGAVRVTISPGSAEVQSGDTLTFVATVTGTSNTAVNWTAEDTLQPTQSVPFGGVFSPSLVYTAHAVFVRATSVADPSKYAAAIVNVIPAKNGPTMTIQPQVGVVQFGGTLQLNAVVTGATDSSVSWSPPNLVTPAGLYTADNSSFGIDTVFATLTSNPSVRASATFYLLPPVPVITGIFPAQATTGDQVEVQIRDRTSGVNRVYFSGPAGSLIPAGVTLYSASGVFVTVPLGAQSGPVFAEGYIPGFSFLRSGPFPFTRVPRLRIVPQQKDLATGESTRLSVRQLGEDNQQSFLWNVQLGSVSVDGVYQAPASVPADIFTPVSVCVSGTKVCTSTLLGLHPFRITPSAPVTAAGSTLQLSAPTGSAGASPSWKIEAGGGSVSPSGAFTAPTAEEDAGGVPVSVTLAGQRQETSVAVTGLFPGLVNRVYDYTDLSASNPLGSYATQVAISGKRAYVVVSDHGIESVNRYTWIDVYDISDVAHPVWLNSIEPPMKPQTIITSGNLLLVVAAQGVPTNYGDGGAIAIFDISAPRPVIRAYTAIPGLQRFSFSEGRLYGILENPPNNPGYGAVFIFDVLSGSSAVLQAPLPSFPPPGAGVASAIGQGNRLYVGAVRFVGNGTLATLLAFDSSTQPATLLGMLDDAPAVGPLKLAGNYLLGGTTIYDISQNVPVIVGNIPDGNVADWDGKRALTYSLIPTLNIQDTSDPANPKIVGSLLTGNAAAAQWAGDFVLVPAGFGGLEVYQATPLGGPKRLFGLGSLQDTASPSDQLVRPPYLYAAAGGLAVFDISNTPPTRIGSYQEKGQTATAIQIKDTKLFLGTDQSVVVLDVTDPPTPIKITSLDFATSSLSIAGSTLYVATLDGHLAVVDISDASAPAIRQTIPLPSQAITIRTTLSLLLAAAGPDGLLIFDISSPTSPVLRARLGTAGTVMDVAVNGNTAYLASLENGLVEIDISDPSHPQITSSTPLQQFGFQKSDAAFSIAFSAGIVYVGTINAFGRLYGFDARRPGRPRLVSYSAHGAQIAGYIGTMAFSDSGLFLGGGGDLPWVYIDNTQPRNAINQYLPPAGVGLQPTSAGLSIEAIPARRWNDPKFAAIAREKR
jgi:uncharacterized protein (TIGR03437 family)